MANSRVEAQDEQDFLKTHYETLQKDREKDPRAAFAARPTAAEGVQNGGEGTYGASVVGPMASTSFSLPSVERALERDPEDVTARLAKMVRRVRVFPLQVSPAKDLTPPPPFFFPYSGILPGGSITNELPLSACREWLSHDAQRVDVPNPRLRRPLSNRLSHRDTSPRPGIERSPRQLLPIAPRRPGHRRDSTTRRCHVPDACGTRELDFGPTTTGGSAFVWDE